MHILYLTSFYPTESNPHHGIFFRDHAEALATGHDVSILNIQVPSLKSDKRFFPRLESAMLNQVLTVHSSAPVVSHRFQSSILKAEIKALKKGFNHIQDHRPVDIIVAQCVLPAGRWASFLYSQKQIPYITIDHYSFLGTTLREHYHEAKTIYEHAVARSVVSDHLCRLIPDTLRSSYSFEILGNVLSPAFTYKQDPDTNTPLKWLAISYDDPKKGPDILSEAWFQYSEKNPEATLTLIGSGTFEELRAHPRVTHHSSITRSEMPSIMANHHSLLSTSRIETFGMVVAEMLAVGRPVVITPSGGPESFVNKACGEIADDLSPESIAESMNNLQAKYQEFNFKQISQEILNKFGAEAYLRKMNQLLPN